MARAFPALHWAGAIGVLLAIATAAADDAEEIDITWSLGSRRLSGKGLGLEALPESLDISFDAAGARFDLRLQRNRALLPHGAKHLLHFADGGVAEGPTPRPCFYVGEVVGDRLGTAAVSTCDGGVSGLVIGHKRAVTLAPARGAVPREDAAGSAVSMLHSARKIADPGLLERHGDIARFMQGLGGSANVTSSKRRLAEGTVKYVEVFVFNDVARFRAFGGQPGLSELAAHSASVLNAVTAIYRKPPDGGAQFPYTVQVVMVGQQTFVEADPWDERVTMVGAETDCSSLLDNFNEWGQTQSQASGVSHTNYDTRVLLSGRDFDGDTVGLAGMSVMCWKAQSGSVNMCGRKSGDVAQCASTVAHELGHNFGMNHDSVGNLCKESGLIMEAVGGATASSRFSSCSASYITSFFESAYIKNGECLENSPTRIVGDAICGNGFVESGEDCDCGREDCADFDPCCNGATCSFKDARYECSALLGPCCESCMFVKASARKVCRAAKNACDLPDMCPGGTAECGPDVFAYPGEQCVVQGYPGLCSGGRCQSLNATCALDLNRDFQGRWDLTEPCAKFNDDCRLVVCHDKSDASAYECGQAFAIHGKHMTVPDGAPCWFPGSRRGLRIGMCSAGRCKLPHALAEAPMCGNGGVDFGEECDCGASASDSCCDCATCRLKEGRQCSSRDPCCDGQCRFAAAGTVCRAAAGECDTAEVCSGAAGACPSDRGETWGSNCTAADGQPSTCYGKVCLPSLDAQCAATTGGEKPVAGREPDGATPYTQSTCRALMCCTSCAIERGTWDVNGQLWTNPYLCAGCTALTSWTEFTIGDVASRLYLGAAEDGTQLSVAAEMCLGGASATPPASCASGRFLEASIGRCMPCDSACAECSGPSSFDCIGFCRYGQDSRGACAISPQQVKFAGPGATVSTTFGPTTTPTMLRPSATTALRTSSAAASAAGRTLPTVSFTMTIQSVSYDQLLKASDLHADFVAKLKAVVAASVSVPFSSVTIALSAGSVHVEAEVIPPVHGSVTAEGVAAVLEDAGTLDALKARVVTEISALPNISTVSSGTIVVKDVSAPRLLVGRAPVSRTFRPCRPSLLAAGAALIGLAVL